MTRTAPGGDGRARGAPSMDLSSVPAELLAACVAATRSSVLIADAREPDHPLVWVNDAFEATSGYRAEQAIGRNARFMQGPLTDRVAVAGLRAALRMGRPNRSRLLNYRADGSTWWNEMYLSPLQDAEGRLTHFLGVQNDVTDQVEMAEQAAHAATHDALTGLANRVSFIDQLQREIARSTRDRRALAVYFLDLDGFKEVNDTHGHSEGDRVLVQVADRLRGRLRGADLVARLGGDEFLALAVDLPGDGAAASRTVAEDLADALAAPFDVAGTAWRIGVSIGTACHPRDGGTAGELVATADAAMYRAKPSRGTLAAAGSGPGRSVGNTGAAAPSRRREFAVGTAFLDLTRDTASGARVTHLLGRLVEHCADLLGAAAVGVLVPMASGRLAVLAHSRGGQADGEAFQLQTAAGPAPDCVRTGRAVVVDDLIGVTGRWPGWAPRALACGVRSTYALPMRRDGQVVGALSVLGDRVGLVRDPDHRLGQALADVATSTLFATRGTPTRLPGGVEQSLASRVLVEQATGILAADLRLTTDEAHAALRSHSRVAQRRLDEVAHDLVSGQIGSDVFQPALR